MYLGMMLFCLGVGVVAMLPVLPELASLWWMAAGFLTLVFAPRLRPLGGLLLGLTWAIYSGHYWLITSIPADPQPSPTLIEARVTQVPTAGLEHFRFPAEILGGQFSGRKLILSWYGNDPPSAGEIWRFYAHLKKPTGTLNIGLFDYKAWMLSQGIHGTGYVVLDGRQKRVAETPAWALHHHWRQRIKSQLQQTEMTSEAKGMLSALMIGESTSLLPETWEVLSKTGTNHLFVVSGLHVGMVAALLLTLVRALGINGWLSIGITCAALIVYSLLVGFGLPVQRAMVMCMVALCFVQASREIAVWRTLLLALTIVLVMSPFATLSAGFWLSFSAVGGLVFAFYGWQRRSFGVLSLLTRTQAVALVSTAPVLLCWIGQFSVVSVMANLIAVPLMGLVIVPLVFSYLVTVILELSGLSHLLLWPLISALQMMNVGLVMVAELDGMIIKQVRPGPAMFLALVGCLMFLLPKTLMPRWLGAILWLPMFTLPQSPYVTPNEQGELTVEVLDVGQGLSVIVMGPETTLVYDAGPSFGSRDSGQSILVPTLRRLGRDRIDLMIVSHGDNDHAGGAQSLHRAIPVHKSLSSAPDFGSHCRLGDRDYGDLKVRWLSIKPGISGKRNDLSCVLHIETAYGSVLLPGDIEAKAEMALLSSSLSAQLLLSPHHGSRSSSTPAFINAVAPNWVVHSSGEQNRFGHPHGEVVQRFFNRGIRQYGTAQSGAITFLFRQDSVRIVEARSFRPRFWYDPRLRSY